MLLASAGSNCAGGRSSGEVIGGLCLEGSRCWGTAAKENRLEGKIVSLEGRQESRILVVPTKVYDLRYNSQVKTK